LVFLESSFSPSRRGSSDQIGVSKSVVSIEITDQSVSPVR